MRYLPFVLACTLLRQGQPFVAPVCVRKQSPVLRARDETDADEAARIEEMRKRMEGMFSGAEAEAAPAAEDAPATPADNDLWDAHFSTEWVTDFDFSGTSARLIATVPPRNMDRMRSRGSSTSSSNQTPAAGPPKSSAV